MQTQAYGHSCAHSDSHSDTQHAHTIILPIIEFAFMNRPTVYGTLYSSSCWVPCDHISRNVRAFNYSTVLKHTHTHWHTRANKWMTAFHIMFHDISNGSSCFLGMCLSATLKVPLCLCSHNLQLALGSDKQLLLSYCKTVLDQRWILLLFFLIIILNALNTIRSPGVHFKKDCKSCFSNLWEVGSVGFKYKKRFMETMLCNG